jgi:hypothetical protein
VQDTARLRKEREVSCEASSRGNRRYVLSGVYGAQELHDLIVDLSSGFVLYPVAHIVDFESSHETRKANTEFFYGGIESRQAIRQLISSECKRLCHSLLKENELLHQGLSPMELPSATDR